MKTKSKSYSELLDFDNETVPTRKASFQERKNGSFENIPVNQCFYMKRNYESENGSLRMGDRVVLKDVIDKNLVSVQSVDYDGMSAMVIPDVYNKFI